MKNCTITLLSLKNNGNKSKKKNVVCCMINSKRNQMKREIFSTVLFDSLKIGPKIYPRRTYPIIIFLVNIGTDTRNQSENEELRVLYCVFQRLPAVLSRLGLAMAPPMVRSDHTHSTRPPFGPLDSISPKVVHLANYCDAFSR